MSFFGRGNTMKFLQDFMRGRPKHKPLGLHSNRSQRGMFAGKDVRFGNKISFSERKTRRKWLPNVQNKRLWSETLNEHIPMKVTTAALRGVDKAGGLDNYLLSTSNDKLRSSQASAVKSRILDVLGDAAEERVAQVRSMLLRRMAGLLDRATKN